MKLLPLLNRFFRINQGHGDINQLQHDIMELVDIWVRNKKSPVPRKYLISEIMRIKNVPLPTVKTSLKVLVQKGYIRKAIVVINKTFYVMLRSI